MKQTCVVFAATVLGILAGLCCARRQETAPLHAEAILGSTAADLIERLGKPTQNREGRFVRWADVDGVRVFVAFEEGSDRAAYVAYTFESMVPFDESKAFEVVGLEPPADGAKAYSDGKARRWEPYGKYDRLVVSTETKVIALGTDPFRPRVP